jgi:hypothetical protein
MGELAWAVGLLSIFYLMLGGAFIIHMYDAYKNTRQKFLLKLSTGFFFLIVGGALTSLFYFSRGEIGGYGIEYVITSSVLLQIAGISLIYHAIIK